jgi:CRISPR-associated protein Cas1
MAGKAYFGALPYLLGDKIPKSLHPTGRSRRPPRDPFNALLSFGYSLLYRAVQDAVLAVGLEPSLGFFHRPRSSAHPLVLDLMELFRTVVWDMVVIGSMNRRQWDLARDFTLARDHVWLSDSGRKQAIDLFERRLEESWKHPVLGYSLSYRRSLELEVRLLEKEWNGNPGLFARARLR